MQSVMCGGSCPLPGLAPHGLVGVGATPLMAAIQPTANEGAAQDHKQLSALVRTKSDDDNSLKDMRS